MKIKEIISEAKDISSRWDTFAKVAGDTLKGWGDIMGRHTKMQGFYQPTRYSPDANKEPIDDKDMWDVKKGIRKVDSDDDSSKSEKTTSGDQEQPKPRQQQQQRREQPKPKDNPNANLNTKIGYLVQQGILQSGRITDDEKRYIDSVDVWVDENKFSKEDPGTKFIKATRPHHSLFIGSVQIPMKDWQEALGRSGEGLSGYVSFDLTPAGWWSTDFNAYINPNNRLDDLVSRYQRG